MWWFMIQRCSSQASFVNTVSFEVTPHVVELKSGTRCCPLFVDDFLSQGTEIPHKCTARRKFQGHRRMCLVRLRENVEILS